MPSDPWLWHHSRQPHFSQKPSESNLISLSSGSESREKRKVCESADEESGAKNDRARIKAESGRDNYCDDIEDRTGLLDEYVSPNLSSLLQRVHHRRGTVRGSKRINRRV